jgi:hypothetical protein
LSPPNTAIPELLLDPFRQVGLAPATVRGHIEAQHLAALGNGLGEGGVPFHRIADEREHSQRGRPFEVVLNSLQVGRLPALDVLDDHEPVLDGEEAERVAGGGDVLSARLVRA